MAWAVKRDRDLLRSRLTGLPEHAVTASRASVGESSGTMARSSGGVGYADASPELILLQEIGVALFACGAILAARVLARVGRLSSAGSGPVTKGMQMRRNLTAGLFAASACRCISLVLEVSWEENCDFPLLQIRGLELAQRHWVWNLVDLMPAAFFLSAFSVVALCWVQVHYISALKTIPFLDCCFVVANVTCYLLVATIAACTWILQAYNHLGIYLMCILGSFNSAVALSYLYYGFTAASMAYTFRKRVQRHQYWADGLACRVVVLTVACPLALLIRGSWYLAWGLSLGRPTNLVNLLLCYAGEWFPLVVALGALNPAQRGEGLQAVLDHLEDSSDSDSPLLQTETPEGAAPPLERNHSFDWFQTYPTPV